MADVPGEGAVLGRAEVVLLPHRQTGAADLRGVTAAPVEDPVDRWDQRLDEVPLPQERGRALGHSIYTEADTADDLRAQVRDAVTVHFDEGERPRVIRLHFVREEVLAA